MKAVQFDCYGPAGVLQILRDAPLPTPGPGELLVRVRSSSINPIDCATRSGYGKAFFAANANAVLPIRPGRDVAGEVVAVGPNVSRFKCGAVIYAATLGGAHAEYALVPESWAALKPASMDFIQAGSLPYVALTTWTALVEKAGLTAANAPGKRVIVPRAAGGVGGFAVQLVKAWGGYVAALCSTRNVEHVRALGADLIIDHTKEDPRTRLHDFDIAFDTSFDTEEMLLGALRTHQNAAYVSIVTPKLRLIDQYGLEDGQRRGSAWFEERVATQRALGRSYHWAFTQPSGDALREIGKLVDSGRIRAVIDRTYTLEQIIEAHQHCERGSARGKIALEIALP